MYVTETLKEFNKMQLRPIGLAIVAALSAVSIGLSGCSGDTPSNTSAPAQVNQATTSQQVSPAPSTEASRPIQSEQPSTSASLQSEHDRVLSYLTNPSRAENIRTKVRKMGAKIAKDMQNGMFGPTRGNDNVPHDTGWTTFETMDGNFGIVVKVEDGILKFDQIYGITLRNKAKDPATEVTFAPPNDLPDELRSNNRESYWVLTSAASGTVVSTDMTSLDNPGLPAFSPTTLADMTDLDKKIMKRADDNLRSWYPSWKG